MKKTIIYVLLLIGVIITFYILITQNFVPIDKLNKQTNTIKKLYENENKYLSKEIEKLKKINIEKDLKLEKLNQDINKRDESIKILSKTQKKKKLEQLSNSTTLDECKEKYNDCFELHEQDIKLIGLYVENELDLKFKIDLLETIKSNQNSIIEKQDDQLKNLELYKNALETNLEAYKIKFKKPTFFKTTLKIIIPIAAGYLAGRILK